MSLRWTFDGDEEVLGVPPCIVVSPSALVKQSETLVVGEY
jgi:hypothetical protein